MGIEIESKQVIITPLAVLVELTTITVKLILISMSLTIKFRDRKSTCNDGHSLLIPFSSREDIIWPLDPYIISALNVIPHHSHMHLHLLN